MDLFVESAQFGRVIEGSLEANLSTKWTDETQSQEGVEPGDS